MVLVRIEEFKIYHFIFYFAKICKYVKLEVVKKMSKLCSNFLKWLILALLGYSYFTKTLFIKITVRERKDLLYCYLLVTKPFTCMVF